MPRQRLGVVLLLAQPLAAHVDGLRRALGDPSLARIASHVTLVPPLNVADRDVPAVLAALRAAGAAATPLHLRLGPGATFHPVEPVVHLAVGGDLDGYEALRTALLAGPLARTVHDPWVPHVTVASSLDPQRIPAAVEALAGFAAETTIDRAHLMVQRPDRTWHPVADVALGPPPGIGGRGGLEVELAVTGRPDLEAAALLDLDGDGGGRPFALTARSGGELVGAAWGWTAGEHLALADLVVAAAHRNLGFGRRLLRRVEDLARDRGCTLATASAPGEGPALALLTGSGWVVAGEGGPGRFRRFERRIEAEAPR
ncbi:MAG: GNAT family N-acetyltransferase [Acidimicrobiia bacterium]